MFWVVLESVCWNEHIGVDEILATMTTLSHSGFHLLPLLRGLQLLRMIILYVRLIIAVGYFVYWLLLGGKQSER